MYFSCAAFIPSSFDCAASIRFDLSVCRPAVCPWAVAKAARASAISGSSVWTSLSTWGSVALSLQKQRCRIC